MHFYLAIVLFGCIHISNAHDNFTFDHIVATQSGQKYLWNETNQDKLKKDLFVNYDRYAKPSGATEVSLGLAGIFLEADEKRSVIIFHTWLRAVWDDSKLQWDPDNYNNASLLRIANHELWHPDIYLFNSVTGGEPIFQFGSPHALVYFSGEVLLVPPVKQTVICEFDLRYWPFDTQHCELIYASWIHDGLEIKLKLYNNEKRVDLSDIFHISVWNITNSTGEVMEKYYECCPEPHYFVRFNITFERNPSIYTSTVVTPSVVNAIMILAQFWLPVKSKQKLYLNGYLLIILSGYLLYFMDTLGGTAKSTPIILQFHVWSLYVVCFGIVINVIATGICKSKTFVIIEIYAKKIFGGRMGKMLLLQNYYDSTSNRCTFTIHGDYNDETKLCELAEEDTCFLSILLNRLLFLIYILVVINVIFTM